MLKHVGKMKHNGAKVCVVYRTLPGDAYSALVVGTAGLSDLHHNSLMVEVESGLAQQANELGDHVSNRYFQDGGNILETLHRSGKLVKVRTVDVMMTPTMSDEVSLDQLNLLIAEQKGITIEQLAIKDDMPHVQHKTKVENIEITDLTKRANTTEVSISDGKPSPSIAPPTITESVTKELKTAGDYRSEADRLYKEAAKLKKLADDLDPPKKKVSSVTKNKETT